MSNLNCKSNTSFPPSSFSLLQRAIGEEAYDKIRRFIQFRPDETHGLEGAPQKSHFEMPGVERIKGLR